MIRLLLLIAALALGAAPVRAALSQAELSEPALSPAPGARLPATLPLVDETGAPITPAEALAGRPAVLLFADYTCTTLCGTALTMAAGSLIRTGLRPGGDYVLLVIGINPRDGPVQAAAAKAAQIGDGPLASASLFLTGDPGSLAEAQAALGYTARWDAENKQYAHPLGALLLTRDGRVSRVLGGLDLDPEALRTGLIEASSGRTGDLGQWLRLLCYGFDPARGVYLAFAMRALMFGAVATVLFLAAFLVVMTRRRVH